MKIRKAFWACSLVLPATIVPLSTATSCSQTWGYKSPISIGSNIAGSDLDPYANIRDDGEHLYDEMVDLNGEKILDQLQSNYSIDVAHSTYYSYCLPEKWNSELENAEESITGGKIVWDKGGFELGSAGWRDSNSGDYVKAGTITGKRTLDSKDAQVSETKYSYRNNMQSSNSELVSLIGTTMSQIFNYALQYQGSQIGSEYSETNPNLSIAWGGNDAEFKHGDKDSLENRVFMESIFASNAVSGTGKSAAALRPSHVQFLFDDMPIIGYKKTETEITGVHDETLKLLNGNAVIPSDTMGDAQTAYWSSRTDQLSENIYNIRTDKTETFKYRVYTYTNVPVKVAFTSFTKSFVNPQKNDSFKVEDYYVKDKVITDSIGNSWVGTLKNFTTYIPEGETSVYEKPTANAFTFTSQGDTYKVEPIHEDDKYDARIKDDKLYQDHFIVLLNYAYKEYEAGPDSSWTPDKLRALDRVTMTGLSTIFPAYMTETLKSEKTFYKIANNDSKVKNHGYIFDESKINHYSSLFLELLKRSSGQGLITDLTKLNDTSKQLLKFLQYMLGDSDLKVYTHDFLSCSPMDIE